MIHNDLTIEDTRKWLLEKAFQASTPKRMSGHLLEAAEIIQQQRDKLNALSKSSGTDKNAGTVGNVDIADRDVYLSRMQKTLLDKAFFVDKIFDPIENVIDFGCANGDLIKLLKHFMPECKFYGYDASTEMIAEARKNVPDVQFESDWDKLPKLDPEKTLINLSSVVHEVYSYGTQESIRTFWNRVFRSGFRYITIRDMFMSDDDIIWTNVDASDAEAVRKNEEYADLLADYENRYGKISTSAMYFAEFLLKYTYREN